MDWNLLAVEANAGEVKSFAFEKLYQPLLLLEARLSLIQEHENGILDSLNLYLAYIGLLCGTEEEE